MTTGDAAEQAKQALDNLSQILTAAGSSLSQVVKTTVLLVDMADFKAVNEVYGELHAMLLNEYTFHSLLAVGSNLTLLIAGSYFGEKPPARVCYAVKALPLNAKVEIDAIAVV